MIYLLAILAVEVGNYVVKFSGLLGNIDSKFILKCFRNVFLELIGEVGGNLPDPVNIQLGIFVRGWFQ